MRFLLMMCVMSGVVAECSGQVTPLSTRRELYSSAAGDSVFEQASDSNYGLGNFSSFRSACVSSPLGYSGCGFSSLDSGIQGDRFHAVGSASANTSQGNEVDLSQAYGRSGFEIRFRVDIPVRYWLTGSIRGNYGLALVTLFGPGGGPIHQYSDSMNELTIENSGVLAPGVYEVHMAAEASMDPSFWLGGTNGEYSATMRWAPYCAADFNTDGFADGFDYDDFVACFEGDFCPPGQSSDFNGDGFTDGFDYDAFVSAFEAGCS